MTKIYWMWIKQFHNKNEIKRFQEKISEDITWYSFFMVKMNIVDLVKLSSTFPLKENYSFEWDNKIENPIFEWWKEVPDFLWEVDLLEFEDSENLISNQIQRRQKEDRLLKIWKYLRYSKFPFFPTSIVWAINDPWITFKSLSNDIFEIDLDKADNSIFIVDGLHRLLWSVIKKSELEKKNLIINDPYWITESIENINWEDYVFANKNMEVIVTLLINTPIELQASIFQTINFEARRISPSMYYNLFDFKNNDISDIELSHSVVKNLIELDKIKKSSIWKKIFLSEYHKKVALNRKLLTISQSSFAEKINDFYKTWHLFYFYEKEDWKYPGVIFKEDEYNNYFIEWEVKYYNAIKEKLAQLLNWYFEVIAEMYKDEWDKPEESQVSKTTWISVFMNIFEIIFVIWLLKENDNLDNIKLENFNLNINFTKEIILKIQEELKKKNLSFKKEDLLWSAWMWLQSRLTREVNMIIENYINDTLLSNFKIKFDSLIKDEGGLVQLILDSSYNNMNKFNIRRLLDSYIRKNSKTENSIKWFIPDNNFYILSMAYILKSVERRF